MESNVQTSEFSVPQATIPPTISSSTNKIRTVLQISLGAFAILGSLLIGIQIGKGQAASPRPAESQGSTLTQARVILTMSPAIQAVATVPAATRTPTPRQTEPISLASRLTQLKDLPLDYDYSKWKEVKVPELGFSVKMPNGWRVAEKDLSGEKVLITSLSLSDEQQIEKKGGDGAWIYSKEGYALIERQVLDEIEISVGSKQPSGYNPKDNYDEQCLNKYENPFQGKTFCVGIIDSGLPATGGIDSLTAYYFFKSGSRYFSFRIESVAELRMNETNKQEVAADEAIKKAIVASFKFI